MATGWCSIDIERATGVPVDRGGCPDGRYRQGTGGEQLTLDAIEFCRTISGRTPGDGLLATLIWF